jgi:hypothetical protein
MQTAVHHYVTLQRGAASSSTTGSEQVLVVHPKTRYGGASDAPHSYKHDSYIQGSYTCTADGTCVLKWSNTYSRLRGKQLSFVVEAAAADAMRAAIEAADATAHKAKVGNSAIAGAH